MRLRRPLHLPSERGDPQLRGQLLLEVREGQAEPEHVGPRRGKGTPRLSWGLRVRLWVGLAGGLRPYRDGHADRRRPLRRRPGDRGGLHPEGAVMGAILGIAYLLFLCVAVVVWVGPRAVAVMLLVSA